MAEAQAQERERDVGSRPGLFPFFSAVCGVLRNVRLPALQGVCPFPRCKYSHEGQFQATGVLLRRDSGAGERCTQSALARHGRCVASDS